MRCFIKDIYRHLTIGDSRWGLLRIFFLISYVIALLILFIVSIVTNQRNSHLWVLLFLPVPITICTGAMFVGELYEIAWGKALRYLISSISGLLYPVLNLLNGTESDPFYQGTNLLEIIGGPGVIIINQENIVLFDNLTGPSKVRSGGEHFVSRFERINFIADLHEQFRQVEPFEVITKDGIRIQVTDVQYGYKLWANQKEKQNKRNVFPYSIEAVNDMTNNIPVRSDGTIDWHRSIKIVITGTISDYIEMHLADHLLEPDKYDLKPREEIIVNLRSSKTRDRMKSYGAELVWFDIGNFYPVNEEVSKRLTTTWKKEKQGEVNLTLARGEAELIALKELGQNESQTKLLNAIDRAINDLDLPKNDEQTVRMLFQLEITNILESLSGNE